MTDLQQADSKRSSVKATTITLLTGAVAGSIIGLTAWSLLLTGSQAIAIVSIGRFDLSPFSLIEEPQSVIERIKSSNFVAAVSARAGIPELSTLLPAKQYGASGALSARSLRDPNLIEIRINLPQPELALKATTAAVDQLIADHDARTAPLIQNLQSALTVLEGHESEMIKASNAIAKRVSEPSQNEDVGPNDATLLSARALTEGGLSALVKNKSELWILMSNIRKSQVIAVPTVTTTRAGSLYRAVAAGAIAGLLAGLLLLQTFPRFFRAGRPGLETNQPAPV
jgi:hypothetical protein